MGIEAKIIDDARKASRHSTLDEKQLVASRIEARMVRAAFTLRQQPNIEAGYLHVKAAWPEFKHHRNDYVESEAPLSVRLKTPPTREAVSDMLPMIEMVRLIPDMEQRQILWWACHHQDGVVGERIPWKKVSNSTDIHHSKYIMRRRYESALNWLAAIVINLHKT